MIFGFLFNILVIYYLVINLVLFGAMWLDKRKAVKEKQRIPEATLFFMAIFGGAIGGLIGMFVFNHKIRKIKFYLVYGLSLVAHSAFMIFLIF